MNRLIEKYVEASFEVKMFWLMVILYGVALLASTLYPYLRLDYARSYPQQKEQTQNGYGNKT